MLGPLTILTHLCLRSGGYSCSRYLQWLNHGSTIFLKCQQSAKTYSVGTNFLVQVHFQLGSLLGHLWSLESLFLVLAILPLFIFSCSRMTWSRWQTAWHALHLTKTEIRGFEWDYSYTILCGFAAHKLLVLVNNNFCVISFNNLEEIVRG